MVGGHRGVALTLDYDIAGSGRPIVLLHGALSHRRVFGYQLLGLSRTHRVIAPDLPGFGRSPWDPHRPWLTQAVDDVRTLLEQLEAQAPVVVGWSLGGFVARELADATGSGTLVLVGVSASAIPESVRASMEKRMLADFPRFARGMIRTFTSSGVSADTEEWLYGMALATGLDVHVAALVRTAAVMRLPVPDGTRVLVGAHDQVVPATANSFDNVQTHVFESSGHCPFIEQPHQFNEVLAEIATW